METPKKGLTKSAIFDKFDKLIKHWGRSEAGLSRWPVKPEIAGSSPVAPVLFLAVRQGINLSFAVGKTH